MIRKQHKRISTSDLDTIHSNIKYAKNKLLKLFKDKAHHWHDACALFWLSKANEKHHWRDIDEWTRSNYCYLAEKFSQDERYTEEITQAASTLWIQWM